MEKNTFLAVAVSFGILLIWTTLFPPAPPEKVIDVSVPPERKVIEANSTMVIETKQTATETNDIMEIQAVNPDLPAKIIEIETNNLRMSLDSRGGIVTNLQLKHYQHFKKSISLADWFPILESILGQGNPTPTKDNLVQMINHHVDTVSAFSVEFDGEPQLTKQFKKAVYASNTDQLLLVDSGRQAAQLVLTSPVIDGLQLIKTFEFYPDTYVIQYKIQVINRTEAVRSLNIQHHFGEGRVPDTSSGQGTHTGAIYFSDGSVEVEDNDDIQQEFRVFDIEWFGLEDHYFVTAVASRTPIKYGAFQSYPVIKGRHSDLAPTFSVRLPPVDLQSRKQIESIFEMYYGPKEENAMKTFGRQLILSQQMMLEAVAKPLLLLLNWINGYVGNYGVAIILLTIIVRVALFPLTLKGMKSMKRMQQLQPKMKKLQEKYKGNKEKLNVEMMALYKKNKVNPLGGCVPLLLQIPIFLGLYSGLSTAVELRHTPFYGWMTDLSAPDGLAITPIIMGATMYLQQKMSPQTMMDPTQQKIMNMLPIIFTFFTFTFPSGLLIYWVTSNVLSIGQQYIINNIKEPEQSND